MSTGAFVRSRYETDLGTVHGIRVQPETLSLTFGSTANSGSTDPIDGVVSVKVSKGRRGIGIRPRTVTIQFTSATPTGGYKAGGYLTLPILKAALYNLISKDDACTYQTQSAVVVYKTPEYIG